MILPSGTWTTVAHSNELFVWHYINGHDSRTLQDMARRGDVVLMQKRTEINAFDLLARPTCEAWRRIRRRLAENPLPARVVRR